MRVCPKTRNEAGFKGLREPTWGVFRPADPEPSLQSNLEVNMKMVKSLILGSAAGLLAMSGAQAADLPVKAKPVEYVKICSLYGAGFFYIPGTDTCIKLGGYLRVDTTFHGGIYASTPRSTAVSTMLRSGAGTAAKVIASAIRSTAAPVWRSRLIPALPLNTASSAPSCRATSSSTTSALPTRQLSPLRPVL